jgi:hypothetical protein
MKYWQYWLKKKIKCPVCGHEGFPKHVEFERLIPRRADQPFGQWIVHSTCGHTFKISDDEANEHGVTAEKESLWLKIRRKISG